MGYYYGEFYVDDDGQVYADDDGVHLDDDAGGPATVPEGGYSDEPWYEQAWDATGGRVVDAVSDGYQDVKDGAKYLADKGTEIIEHGQDDADKLLFGLTVTETVLGGLALAGLGVAWKKGWI